MLALAACVADGMIQLLLVVSSSMMIALLSVGLCLPPVVCQMVIGLILSCDFLAVSASLQFRSNCWLYVDLPRSTVLEIGSRIILMSLILSLNAEFPLYFICCKVSSPDHSGLIVLSGNAGSFRSFSGQGPTSTFPPESGSCVAGDAAAGRVVVVCTADVEGDEMAAGVVNSCKTSRWCLSPMLVMFVVEAIVIVASVLHGLLSSDFALDTDIFVPLEKLSEFAKSFLSAKFCAGVCSLLEIVVFWSLERSRRSLTCSASSIISIGLSRSEFLFFLGAVSVDGTMSAAGAVGVLMSVEFPAGAGWTGCCWLLLARDNKYFFRCGGIG